MNQVFFVYNADAGFFNMVADMAHKVFSPSTYPCSLCDLTYGVFHIRPEWDEFVKNSAIPFVFLHKDEFIAAYPDWQMVPLPLVAVETGGEFRPILSAEELGKLRSIAELKKMVADRAPVGT